MIRVDAFLNRVPRVGYKCFDFVREVWFESFGVDVGDKLVSLEGTLRDRRLLPGEMRKVTRLDKPVDPCFVVFQRKRTTPHIGILYMGRVLHLSATGAEYTLLRFVARPYTRVSYYL